MDNITIKQVFEKYLDKIKNIFEELVDMEAESKRIFYEVDERAQTVELPDCLMEFANDIDEIYFKLTTMRMRAKDIIRALDKESKTQAQF